MLDIHSLEKLSLMCTRRHVQEIHWSTIYSSKNLETVCPSSGKQENKTVVYSDGRILHRSKDDPIRATYISMDKPHKIQY